MRTEAELIGALDAWKRSEYFPFAFIKPVDRGFDFVEGGDDAAAVAPVWIYDEPEIIANVVCWEMGAPGNWWVWDRDRHPIIGGDYLDICRRRGQPARLAETPAEWFQSVGTCVCVLDWDADLRAIFGDTAVVCADEAMERRYARAFRWKPKRANIHRATNG